MDLPPPPPSATGWSRVVTGRILWGWPAKLAGTSLGMVAFFVSYFAVLNHPLYPVATMPLTALDRAIGFQPWALPLYLSLWFYVSLAPSLVVDRRELASYGVAWVALIAATPGSPFPAMLPLGQEPGGPFRWLSDLLFLRRFYADPAPWRRR